MFDPVVRSYRPTDATDLGRLERDARAALVDQRGGRRWLAEHDAVGDRWDLVAADDDTDVLVADLDGVPVGYLVAVLGSDRIVRIDQVWVEPDARENGFGDLLLDTAIENGRRSGAVAVEGEALPGDRHTKNLYERAGIVARLITTYRDL